MITSGVSTDTGTTVPVHLDVYADIACPWCYVAEARLEQALALRPGLEVTRHWRPFQLQPQLPPEGLPWRSFAERKFGGWERALTMFEQLGSVGREAGIAFDFTGIQKANNTADAHRLVLLAERKGFGLTVAHALFRAYFEEGRDLNDEETLLGIAEVAGLERDEMRRYLQSDENRAAVAESQREAGELGVQSVPFYVFNRTYGVSGAQPVDVLVNVLDQIQEVKL